MLYTQRLNIQMHVVFLLDSFSQQPRLSLRQTNDAAKTAAALRRCHLHLNKHRCADNDITTHGSILGWLGGLAVRVSNSQLDDCEFDSRPPRCRVTTLGKLFTPTCLCRSQSSGGSMIDCSVTGRGSCVYHISHYNICLLYTSDAADE